MKIESATVDFGGSPAEWLRAFEYAAGRRLTPTLRAALDAVPVAPSGGWRASLRAALALSEGLPKVGAAVASRLASVDAVGTWDPAADYTCPRCGESKPASAFGCRVHRTVRYSSERAARADVAWARSAVSARQHVPDPVKGADGRWTAVLPTRQTWCGPCRAGYVGVSRG